MADLIAKVFDQKSLLKPLNSSLFFLKYQSEEALELKQECFCNSSGVSRSCSPVQRCWQMNANLQG